MEGGGESNRKSRKKMKRKRYYAADISEKEERRRRRRKKKMERKREEEEERRRRRRKKKAKRKREEEEERRRRRRRRRREKKMKRKRYEEEEERRRRRRKMKMKRKRYYADMPIEEEEASRKKMKMKMEGKTNRRYADIPMDVLVDILSRLPARCVWRLRSVCKEWKSQIESPYFADLQLRHGSKEEKLFMFWNNRNRGGGGSITRFYSINSKHAEFVHEFLHQPDTRTSSTNGLVCYYGTDGEIKVSNPLTRQLINLPRPSFLLSSNPSPIDDLDIGIGFDSTSNTYKVLAIYRTTPPQVQIFTLGKGTNPNDWRNLQLPSPTTDFYARAGVCANGCTFWLTSDYHKLRLGSRDPDMLLRALMTFNFALEKFEFVPLPPDYNIHEVSLWVHEVGGRRCLIESKLCRTSPPNLWTSAPNSRTKLWAHHHFVLPRVKEFILNTGLFPISRGVIMLYDVFKTPKYIFLYNKKGRVVKSIKVRAIPRRFCPLQLHTESLVSLTSFSS